MVDTPEHTPGPWDTQGVQEWSDGKNRCMVGPEYGGLTICEVLHVSDEAEANANARLIASAPGMLAALRKVAKGEGAFNRDPLTHASNCIESMKAIAEAEIAKAVSEVQHT